MINKKFRCNLVSLIKNIFIDFDIKVSFLGMIIMLILAFSNVVGRYIFSSSISFTEEITASVFVLVCTLGTAVAAKFDAHLGLSVVRDLLPKKYQRYLDFLTNIMGAIFSLVLLYTGTNMVIYQFRLGNRTIGLQWPEWIYGTFIPIGAAMMVYRFTETAVKSFKKGLEE